MRKLLLTMFVLLPLYAGAQPMKAGPVVGMDYGGKPLRQHLKNATIYQPEQRDQLWQAFLTPPDSIRVGCYYYRATTARRRYVPGLELTSTGAARTPKS